MFLYGITKDMQDKQEQHFSKKIIIKTS